MKLKRLIYIFVMSTLFFACTSNSSDDLQDNPDPDPTDDNPDPTDDDPTPSLVTYNDDVKSILDGTCVRCHGNPLTSGAPFALITYDQAKNNISTILDRINDINDPMPPAGLMSQSNRDIIEQWQTDGLLEN